MIHRHINTLFIAIFLLSLFSPVSLFSQNIKVTKLDCRIKAPSASTQANIGRNIEAWLQHEQTLRDSIQNELAKEGITIVNHVSYKVLEDSKRKKKIVVEKKDTGNRDASGSTVYAIYCDGKYIRSGISVADIIDAISLGLSYSDWGKSVPDRIVRGAAELLAY